MLLTLPFAVLAIGCGSASQTRHPARPSRATVTIRDFKFGPTRHVAVGATVTWVNADSAPHTATGNRFDTGTIGKGGRASATFSKPGTYDYVCQFHPFMHGTIVVR